MSITPTLVRRVFDQTLETFFEHEVQEVLEGVNERSNCGRMAICLQHAANAHGLVDYYADTEYNRKQDGKVKTILDGAMRVIAINCDLLLHSRGQIIRQDNLIAIEVKKRDTPPADKYKDRERLRALTKGSYDDIWSADGVALPEHVCGYVLGVFVELDRFKRICQLEYYEGGQKVEQSSRTF
ncbi:hypothetical protein [Roseateles depolymerans]|uniref:Uncharacterized protein n=1 Tax=Roseateles depolymerans TaxID=76731 RepID=A0A0U3MYF9_9BURK|nr:hypothetical protein [Roseateles depolymerans]ALV04987.1 hypothetical protein RD2015_486 [Roseateles depolymerans]REG15001.1 hypothetical protein DES44_3506 [Roseateles depolymerans]